MARGLPPSSRRSPHSGLPALQQREGYRRPLPRSQHQVQRALPRWSPHLGAAQHFPDSAHGPAPRAAPSPCAAPSPSAAQTSAPPAPARSPPAHPSLCARSLSLHRALSLELVVPGTACGCCRRQGGLPDFGPSEDRELDDRSARGFPGLARPPRLLRSCTLSGHISPRRGSARGSLGRAARSDQAGIHALPPESSAPTARAPVRPAPLSGLGSGLRTHPALRSPPAPGALWRAGARRGFTTASEILSPSSRTPPHSKSVRHYIAPQPRTCSCWARAQGAGGFKELGINRSQEGWLDPGRERVKAPDGGQKEPRGSEGLRAPSTGGDFLGHQAGMLALGHQWAISLQVGGSRVAPASSGPSPAHACPQHLGVCLALTFRTLGLAAPHSLARKAKGAFCLGRLASPREKRAPKGTPEDAGPDAPPTRGRAAALRPRTSKKAPEHWRVQLGVKGPRS